MLGNWARMTTTTTGTGNLTLSAATGYPTLNDVVGTNRRFYYSILLDSDATPIEAGIGYLSASTTMVREKVLCTYSSSVFDETSPAAISLAAGTKRVIITALSHGLLTGMPYVGSGAGYKVVSNGAVVGVLGSTSYNDQDQSGRLNVFPWLHEYGGEIDAFIINCTGAGSASQILRIGLYRVGSDGNPGGLIVESGSIDVSSSGVKTSTFTAFVLPPGYYWLGLLSTSSTALYVGSSSVAEAVLKGPQTIGNSLNSNTQAGYATGVSTSAMPSSCPALSWTPNLNVPHVLLRAV